MYDEKKLLEFRKQKDEAWKTSTESPLTEEQKRGFKTLKYFPPNPNLSFELELDKNIQNIGEKVVIKTTGGDEQVYLRAGKVLFLVEGKDLPAGRSAIARQEVEATVFEDPEQEQFQYYLLFRDLTTGKETYENGRMLQIPKKGNRLVVDFNYAYNPYSSYNNNWDCPITPKENILPVRIEAGEKIYG